MQQAYDQLVEACEDQLHSENTASIAIRVLFEILASRRDVALVVEDGFDPW